MLMDTPTSAASVGTVATASAAAKSKHFMLDILGASRLAAASRLTMRLPERRDQLCSPARIAGFRRIVDTAGEGAECKIAPKDRRAWLVMACRVEALCPGRPLGHGRPWRRGHLHIRTCNMARHRIRVCSRTYIAGLLALHAINRLYVRQRTERRAAFAYAVDLPGATSQVEPVSRGRLDAIRATIDHFKRIDHEPYATDFRPARNAQPGRL